MNNSYIFALTLWQIETDETFIGNLSLFILNGINGCPGN